MGQAQLAQKIVLDVHVNEMDVSAHAEFKNHEHVFRIYDGAHDITAFVAVHSTVLGTAEGGIRYKFYGSEDEAITDVMRLSEGMTLKNSAAGLSAGGGKSVVMAHKDMPKPDEVVLQVLAAGLNIINADRALYYGAEDMNISEANLDYMLGYTKFLKGATSADETVAAGNPSPLTALGVFEAMKMAVKHVYKGEKHLRDMTVALQGVGSVGGALACLLYTAGAKLVACDISDEAFEMLADEGVEVERVGLDDIYDVKADIFAPNAIGGTLNDNTVTRLAQAGVKIVCGAANNQQAQQIGHVQSKQLQELGILYCPDFIVNAGGIIWVNQVGENAEQVRSRVLEHMPKSLSNIIELATANGKDMGEIAEDYALSLVK